MAKIILKIILIITCAISGFVTGERVNLPYIGTYSPWVGTLAGLMFALLALELERYFRKVPLKVIFGGSLGLLVGLGIAKLLHYPFGHYLTDSTIRISLFVALAGIFGYIGLTLGSRKIEEIKFSSPTTWFRGGVSKDCGKIILDTSVIIDGRIADIRDAGFIEEPLIIPKFVLSELHFIADSHDSLKRTRGRRGLDILKRLQRQSGLKVEIIDKDYPNKDVDSKLIELALELKARIMTNDYNLTKVAELQGLKVLNINRLANALRPNVLPGEIINIQIIKEGKTEGQGVGYMEDGTMVVIENAKQYLGKSVDVAVTSILQTPAGRMIFTELLNK